MGESSKAAQVGARLGHKVTVKRMKGHQVYRWRATYVEAGKYKSKGFKTKEAAEDWAEEHEEETFLHGTDSTISSSERAAVVDTRLELNEVGLSLREAVNFAIDHQRKILSSCTVEELIERVVSKREKKGRSGRHLRDTKGKLGLFGKEFGHRRVADISMEELDDWLHGLDLESAGSFKSYRNILRMAFNDAVRDGYLEENPVLKIELISEIEKEVGILNPGEARKLLLEAGEEIKPLLAIGLFAGLRVAELEKLDWRDVRFDHGDIRVRAANAKGARNRLIPMSENLRKWLEPHQRDSGMVAPKSEQRMRRLVEAARNAAGFGSPKQVEAARGTGRELRKWPDNALRHSFASYHLAFHTNANELALLLGHTDTKMIFQHYRGLVTGKQAEAYWALIPE